MTATGTVTTDTATTDTTTTDSAAPPSPTRVVDGTVLPVAGRWVVDPGHSHLGFEVRHAATRMRGQFRSFSGELLVAEVPEESWVEVSIDAESIQTSHPGADEQLRAEHWLGSEQFPTLHFRSTEVRNAGDGDWTVVGDLTIRGVTRPITLDASFGGAMAMARGPRAKLGFAAAGRFDRRDYGMSVNVPLPGGELLVGYGVRLQLDVEADLL